MKKIIWIMIAAMCLCACGKEESSLEPQPHDSTVETENDIAWEDYIIWDEKELFLSGIERGYEIWFLADSHVVVQDGSESAEVAEYAAQRMPGFCNEMGITSDQIFSQFIDMANEKKPDMILFGGDIIDFPSDANVSFLKAELDRLEVPFVFAMGNHDWTFPWEYMTPEGSEKYRPVFEEYMYGNFTENQSLDVETVMGNSYANVIELNDLIVLSVDDSSNQVAAEALEAIEAAYELDKPIILMQHVPFSTENLIARAKKDWANPVTLGMQVHGGIAPNEISTDLWYKTHDAESPIKLVLAGHAHFSYEEELSETTLQIVTDAAFKGKAVKLKIAGT